MIFRFFQNQNKNKTTKLFNFQKNLYFEQNGPNTSFQIYNFEKEIKKMHKINF